MTTDRYMTTDLAARRLWPLLIVALLILPPLSRAMGFPIRGPARAVGPRTVVVRGIHVVLQGVAPIAAADPCGPASAPWRCGERAQRALDVLAGAHPLACELGAKIGHGEFEGSCASERGGDLGRAFVAAGWARAEDDRYAVAEAAARAARRGAWAAKPP